MSDETTANDGATQAAPATTQETPQISANAEGQDVENQEPEAGQPRDESGKFTKVQERINELTRARRQAERERDALAQQMESLRSQQQHSPPSDKAPTLADFNYDLDAFGSALAEHSAKQARAFAAQEFAQRQQHQSQEQIAASFETKEREYAAKNPDYQGAVEALQGSIRFDPSVVEVLAKSDNAPALVHHLGKHLDVADRLARMPPLQAVYELARLEAQISAPKAKPVSSAPTPTPTVGGGGVIKQGLDDTLSTDEWIARREAQLKAKRS